MIFYFILILISPTFTIFIFICIQSSPNMFYLKVTRRQNLFYMIFLVFMFRILNNIFIKLRLITFPHTPPNLPKKFVKIEYDLIKGFFFNNQVSESIYTYIINSWKELSQHFIVMIPYLNSSVYLKSNFRIWMVSL